LERTLEIQQAGIGDLARDLPVGIEDETRELAPGDSRRHWKLRAGDWGRCWRRSGWELENDARDCDGCWRWCWRLSGWGLETVKETSNWLSRDDAGDLETKLKT